MDAYCNYIIQTSEARNRELRREAAEYAMSRSARSRGPSRWARLFERLLRRRAPTPIPAATVPLPARASEPEPEVVLRRSA